MGSLSLSLLISNKPFSPLWIFAFIGFLAAVGIVFWGIRKWKLADATKNWPVTEGKVISSGLNWQGGNFIPEVTYEYVVDGVAHKGETISFQLEGHALPKRSAGEIVSRYPEGKTVLVHFDPRNPQLAVLEAGASKLYLARYFVFAMIFLLIAFTLSLLAD
ncbi:DUF3592 domain-containing protein [Acidobacteriia bacterium AH_259_A11_L15]|nr:DUF3592 domain-containing protein [Acidobacteriia bacterium AH_259_A11_L15]